MRTPPKLERLLDRFDRNDFYVRADVEHSDDVLDRLGRRIVLGLFGAAGVLSVAILYSFAAVEAAAAAGALTIPVVLLLYLSFRRRRGLRTSPQFTRQNLRDRRQE